MLNLHTVFQTKNPAYTRQRAAAHIGILVHSTGANNKYVKRYVDAPEILAEFGSSGVVNTPRISASTSLS